MSALRLTITLLKKYMEETDKNLLPNLIDSEALLLPEYIRAEVALENIGYFTPSSKRIKKILTKEKIVAQRKAPDGKITFLKASIIGTGKYGLPITSDLDYYRAFLKLLDEIIDAEGRIPEPLSIPAKKLIRYAGKEVSAREIKEVKDWIARNRYTGIQGYIYNADKGDFTEIGRKPLFPEYRIRGERQDNGEIAETNLVWLADWFVTNYLHGYIRPLDFAFYQRLRKPIAKSLSPLLETGWYASGGKAYAKSYRDLCAEFLMRQWRFLADIKKQLDPSHRELEREHFLRRWEYHKARGKDDIIITYWPGPKFFKDQQAREARKQIADQILRKTKKLAYASSDLSDGQQRLLDWILEVCGDRENEAAYRKVIQQYHIGIIETAIGETKQAKVERRIRTTAGAYFMDTLQRIAAMRA
jgi:hypothetical protein